MNTEQTSKNIFKSSLDSLIPIIEAFDCFAIKWISSILGRRLLIFKCKICKPFLLKIFHLELPYALHQPKTIAFGGIVGSRWLWNGRVFKGILLLVTVVLILLLVTVVGPGLTFISPDSHKINLKNESYLCRRMFARPK